MNGFPLAGRPSGLITQRDFADRAAAVAASAAPGSETARRAAVDLLRQALWSHGYGEGLAILAPLLGQDTPASDAAQAAGAVAAAYSRPASDKE